MAAAPTVSVVVPNCNEGERLELTVRSLREGCHAPLDIIVVDNGSTDGSADFIDAAPWCAGTVRLLQFADRLGVAGARNAGARAARGQVLMFSDAHVLFPPGWDVPLCDALAPPQVGMVSPLLTGWPGQDFVPSAGQRWTSAHFHQFEWLQPASAEPHAVPLLCGAVQAFRRATFDWLGGYDPGMVVWGMEDQEISLRCWLLGREVLSVPTVTAQHLFRTEHIHPVDWFHVLHNDLRAAYAHFGPARVARVATALAAYPGFDRACTMVQDSDIWDRRVALDARRVHADDWFFERFGGAV